MKSMGITQYGDKILETPTIPFDIPAGTEGYDLLRNLDAKLHELGQVYQFHKGMGIAAPQIGVNRSAAVVISGGVTYWMLNPVIIDQSEETDWQYEGCLSFFDKRGRVESPLSLTVKYYYTANGAERITTFTKAAARLVRHEIDHLNGVLYRSRADKLIPAQDSPNGGKPWQYE